MGESSSFKVPGPDILRSNKFCHEMHLYVCATTVLLSRERGGRWEMYAIMSELKSSSRVCVVWERHDDESVKSLRSRESIGS
jgi:hypothetical protein